MSLPKLVVACVLLWTAVLAFECTPNYNYVMANELSEHVLDLNVSIADYDLALVLDKELAEFVEENDLEEVLDQYLDVQRARHRLLMAYELQQHQVPIPRALYNVSYVPALLGYGAPSWCKRERDEQTCQDTLAKVGRAVARAGAEKLAQLVAVVEGAQWPHASPQTPLGMTQQLFGDTAVDFQLVAEKSAVRDLLLHLAYRVRAAHKFYRKCQYGGVFAALFGNGDRLCDDKDCFKSGACNDGKLGYVVC